MPCHPIIYKFPIEILEDIYTRLDQKSQIRLRSTSKILATIFYKILIGPGVKNSDKSQLKSLINQYPVETSSNYLQLTINSFKCSLVNVAQINIATFYPNSQQNQLEVYNTLNLLSRLPNLESLTIYISKLKDFNSIDFNSLLPFRNLRNLKICEVVDTTFPSTNECCQAIEVFPKLDNLTIQMALRESYNEVDVGNKFQELGIYLLKPTLDITIEVFHDRSKPIEYLLRYQLVDFKIIRCFKEVIPVETHNKKQGLINEILTISKKLKTPVRM